MLYNQKIIGIGIYRNNGDNYFFGEGKPLKINLNNRHFEENILGN